MLEQYPKEVRLVEKNYPLRSHAFAMKAAMAALASHRQEKFQAFHEQLMENQKDLSDQKVQEIAGALTLDLERFKKDLADPALERLIMRDVNEGIQAGVRGIPAVFVNGKVLKNRTLQGFGQAIGAELKGLEKK